MKAIRRGLLGICLAGAILAGCDEGSDGNDGEPGPAGATGFSLFYYDDAGGEDAEPDFRCVIIVEN